MGQKKDIVGQRFGNLIVLKDSGLRNNAKVLWTCQCDCGKIVNIRSDKIYSGSATCCTQCNKIKARDRLLKAQNSNSLTIKPGDQYEHLTFLEKLNEKGKSNCYYYKCQCDCGKIIKLESRYWKKTKSCGCYKKEYYKNLIVDLTNQKFGLLTVLERSNKKGSNGCYYWKCKCDCGNMKEINGAFLRDHSIISCGCYKRSAGELKIYELLSKQDIVFEQEKTFDSCRFIDTNALARFDFYLPDYNLLIEYDGEQHFKFSNNFYMSYEEFQKLQERDLFKNNWALKNNIRLKRIPYYDYDKINLEYLLN